MAQVTTFNCDNPGCKEVKKDCNHWWIVNTKGGVFHLFPLGDHVAKGEEIACSYDCVIKILARYMGSVTPRLVPDEVADPVLPQGIAEIGGRG